MSKYTDQIDELMDRLEKLRIEYEKYFIGIEAREPLPLRQQVERDIRRFLGSSKILRAAEKMKMENLRSRFVSYSNLWTRTCIEIENGTYRRHVLMGRERERRAREHDEANKKAGAKKIDSGVSSDGSFDLSAGIDSGVAPKPRRYDSVYTQYKNAGVSVDYGKLETMLKKQETAIREKYGAKKVVSIKVVDGKPKLSAKPIK